MDLRAKGFGLFCPDPHFPPPRANDEGSPADMSEKSLVTRSRARIVNIVGA